MSAFGSKNHFKTARRYLPALLPHELLVIAIFFLSLLLFTLPAIMEANAQSRALPHEIYIRSEKNGTFHGYHQILENPKKGYVRAVYCQKPYWVRPSTVAWTEYESQAGHHLFLELNRRGEREPICDNPDNQVNLDDIDIDKLQKQSLREKTVAPSQVRQSRLNVIRDAFKGFK